MTVCECEPRVEGALKIMWKSAEADPAMTLQGVFTEVVMHERIVHTENMVLGSGETIGSLVETHEFAEQGGVTTMRITQVVCLEGGPRRRDRFRHGSGNGRMLPASRRASRRSRVASAQPLVDNALPALARRALLLGPFAGTVGAAERTKWNQAPRRCGRFHDVVKVVHRLLGIADQFLLEVHDFPQRLDAEERDVAERAARALRFGLEERQPGLSQLLQELAHALLLTPSLSSQDLPEGSGGAGSRLAFDGSLAHLARQIGDELLRGRIGVVLEEVTPLTERREGPLPELPPLPRPKPEGPETFFDVRFVDEIGQAINGLSVEFALGTEFRDVTTNAAGVALLEGVTESAATVTVPNLDELEKILEPRWRRLGGASLLRSRTASTYCFAARRSQRWP